MIAALRDVSCMERGKTMGFPSDVVGRLARSTVFNSRKHFHMLLTGQSLDFLGV